MSTLQIGTTVRLRETQCLDRRDRLARGIVLDARSSSLEPEFNIWWDDGFPAEWFVTDEIEPAHDSELSLPFGAYA